MGGLAQMFLFAGAVGLASAADRVVLQDAPALMGHQQTTLTVNGSSTVAVFGGYTLREEYIHRDINDDPDRLYLDRVTFNDEVYLFDMAKQEWSMIDLEDGASKPPGRIMHSISSLNDTAFVTYGGTVCLFDEGGISSLLFSNALQDMWNFDAESMRWEAVHEHSPLPDCSSALASTAASPLVWALAAAAFMAASS